jgi:hypothetical protein
MKRFLITFVFISMILLFTGCKKNTTDEVFNNSKDFIQNEIKTKITTADISNWLRAKMNPASPLKNNYINKVLQNAQYDKMYVEQFRTNENLIIVPLKNQYFSQHIKQQKNKPIQYLLLVENAEGKIRKGDLILFFPDDAILQKLPANSFHDFFTKEELLVNGSFTLVSLGDVKQYEMIFKNGKKKKFKLWCSNNNTVSNGNNNNTNTASQSCTDWYLVTTYYVNGEPVGSTSEYIGTTCSGSCPPDIQCIEPEGQGGGGENPETPVAVSRDADFTVKKEETSYEDWEIIGTFTLAGKSFTTAANNYFTSITWKGSACIYYSFVASSNWPQSSRYSLFSEVHHTSGLLSNTNAFGNIQSKMYYPNWPALWGGPKTDYYGKGQNWQASVALY